MIWGPVRITSWLRPIRVSRNAGRHPDLGVAILREARSWLRAASSAIVGSSNRALSGSSTPISVRRRETTCVASKECPPSAKKLSRIPTRSKSQHCGPDCCDHFLNRCAGSNGVRLAGPRRQNFPGPEELAVELALGISGSESSATVAPGSCSEAGGAPESHEVAPRPPAEVGHNVRISISPGVSARAITAAVRTDGCCSSVLSISPGSIRKPLNLSCWSRRPRNSSVPSGRQHSVSGAIQTLSRRGSNRWTERIGYEALRREGCFPGISPGDARSSQIELAGDANRRRLQLSIKDVGAGIRDRSADPGRTQFAWREMRSRRVGRGLRWPVKVEHFANSGGVEVFDQRPGHRLTAQIQLHEPVRDGLNPASAVAAEGTVFNNVAAPAALSLGRSGSSSALPTRRIVPPQLRVPKIS